jgi:gliding motility-associated-like protein
LGQDTVYCEDFPVELNAFNAGATYVWSTGDTTARIVAGTSGNYHVEATNVCGTTSDEILIETYACSWQLYVPSCFTPNEDTFNEGWSVSGYNIESIHLTVYNRFGDAVFHTTELGDTWYPSVAVGDDVYNYRIEITPFEGQREVRTGVIYLIR